ncbi:MAG: cytochrome c-type biogenesis protein [Acidimicrobiales bacterium]
MPDAISLRDRVPPPVRTRLSMAALVIVAAVTLVIGSGVGRSAPPSLASRAAALEGHIRCPSCEDLSVAQSEASSAISARRQIVAMLSTGSTDAQIEASFVARYGPSILLEPASSGLGVLVWLLPLVAVVLALGALAALFWRRQRELQRLRAGP